MFNRKLEVKMVKSTKNESATPGLEDISIERKLALASHYIERAIVQAGKAALTYVAVDTLRQVVIARALRK